MTEMYHHAVSVLGFLVSSFPYNAISDAQVSSFWGPAIAALVGFPAVVLAYRQATNARKSADQIEAKRVDADAYERAQRLMEKGIQQLEDQVIRLKTDLIERDQEVMALRHRVRELEDQVVQLRRTAGE